MKREPMQETRLARDSTVGGEATRDGALGNVMNRPGNSPPAAAGRMTAIAQRVGCDRRTIQCWLAAAV